MTNTRTAATRAERVAAMGLPSWQVIGGRRVVVRTGALEKYTELKTTWVQR